MGGPLRGATGPSGTSQGRGAERPSHDETPQRTNPHPSSIRRDTAYNLLGALVPLVTIPIDLGLIGEARYPRARRPGGDKAYRVAAERAVARDPSIAENCDDDKRAG